MFIRPNTQHTPPLVEYPPEVYRQLSPRGKRYIDEAMVRQALLATDLRPDASPCEASEPVAAPCEHGIARFDWLTFILWIIAAAALFTGIVMLEAASKRQSLATQEHFTAAPRAIQ